MSVIASNGLALNGLALNGVAPASETAAVSASHLIFNLSGVLYGVEAFAVREVVALPPITPLHELPPLFRGVAHLREQFVPVLDLNLCLGAPRSLPDEPHRDEPHRDEPQVLVVLEMSGRLAAIAVDEVRDVRPISSHNLGFVPRFDSRFDSRGGSANCLAGVARLDDQNLQLLHLAGFFDLIAPFYQAAQAETAKAPAEVGEDAPLIAVVRLGRELLGLPILWVCEFAPLRAVTPVPGCSRAVVGLMNLRGEVLSLLDIRPALQLSATSESAADAMATDAMAPAAHQVVVVECDDWRVGLVVDEVLDVFGLAQNAVVPLLAGELLSGTAWFGDQMLSLLDVPRLLSQERQELEEV